MTTPPEQDQQLYYPNNLGRIILLAFEEVIGRNGVKAVLNLSGLGAYLGHYPPDTFDLGFPFADLSALILGLEQFYGPRSGRGLAQRAGQATFRRALQEFPDILNVSDLSFRLLPGKMKIRVGLQNLVRAVTEHSDQAIRLEEREDAFLLHCETCALCIDRQEAQPCCHFSIGVLQEAMFWLSGGKYHPIEETQCLAAGDPECTLRIQRIALD